LRAYRYDKDNNQNTQSKKKKKKIAIVKENLIVSLFISSLSSIKEKL
jgi:hypothetical protein